MNNAALAFLLLSLAPAVALADGFSYTYADGSVAFTEGDNNVDQTNYNFEFRAEFDSSPVIETPADAGTFWRAGVDYIDFDDIDADFTNFFGGLGGYAAANERLDFGAFLDLQYATIDVDTAVGSFDDSEWALGVGGFARFAMTDRLDLEGRVTHSTAFDGYTDFLGRILFGLTPNFRIGGGFRLGDSGDGFEARARYAF